MTIKRSVSTFSHAIELVIAGGGGGAKYGNEGGPTDKGWGGHGGGATAGTEFRPNKANHAIIYTPPKVEIDEGEETQ